MLTGGLKRSFFQRVFGIPATRPPRDRGSWIYVDGRVVIALDRVPELARPGAAVRIEGGDLPSRLLVVHDDDGGFHALRNACSHGGRRLDPVPGTKVVQCCSVGRSTFRLDGRRIAGPAGSPVATCPVRRRNGKLLITVRCTARVRAPAMRGTLHLAL